MKWVCPKRGEVASNLCEHQRIMIILHPKNSFSNMVWQIHILLLVSGYPMSGLIFMAVFHSAVVITGVSWTWNYQWTWDKSLSGWWFHPLWKIYKNMSSSLGMMKYPTEWKVIKFHGSKPPIRYVPSCQTCETFVKIRGAIRGKRSLWIGQMPHPWTSLLVNVKITKWKDPPFFMGKSTINGHFQ